MSLQSWLTNGRLVEYDRAGAATRNDAEELIKFATELRQAVVAWLEREHIELMLPNDRE